MKKINVGCWKSCYVLMMIDRDIALDVVLDIDHIDGEGQLIALSAANI